MRFSSKSRVGTILALCFVLLVSLSYMLHAQQPPSNLALYDNFDERFLNPSRWSLSGACASRSVLECVREIQDDKLRLAVRSYGATDSNQGNGFASSELHFPNPIPIKTIAAALTVRQASGTGCPANTANSGGHAILQGSFFNSGTGNPNDDVQALLFFNHLATDPQGGLFGVALLHWQGQFFGGVGLGALSVGQKIVAQLSWDQPHSQFVASWTDVLTGKMTQVFLPYTTPDTTPPAAPDKLIGVRTFPPNCVGTQMTFADLDATFDTVWIGN